jgi:hypothetical protein
MKAVSGVILLTVAVVVVFGLLLALPTMWLWNGCLVGAVGGVHEIGWLQAWGINTLFSILFKPWEGSKKKD